MEENTSNLSLLELSNMINSRYISIIIGGHDLSEKEIQRVSAALRLAALVSVIATDAAT